jgi:hypothetical protein
MNTCNSTIIDSLHILLMLGLWGGQHDGYLAHHTPPPLPQFSLHPVTFKAIVLILTITNIEDLVDRLVAASAFGHLMPPLNPPNVLKMIKWDEDEHNILKNDQGDGKWLSATIHTLSWIGALSDMWPRST